MSVDDLAKIKHDFMDFTASEGKAPDGLMDRKEYEIFAAHIGLTPQTTASLWLEMAHRSGDAVVDQDEFMNALKVIFRPREQLRYCPTCAYEQTCHFCATRAVCPDCTAEMYCPKCLKEGAVTKAKAHKEAVSSLKEAERALAKSRQSGEKELYHPVVFRTPYRMDGVTLTQA